MGQAIGIGKRVKVYDEENVLLGDRGVVTDVDEPRHRLRVKLDSGREVEVSAGYCRMIGDLAADRAIPSNH